MKFQDKFYDVIDHNKYPSSEKSAEKCILRNSYFHHSEPKYALISKIHILQIKSVFSMKNGTTRLVRDIVRE